MGPLIVWATRFVDLFAPDILAATAEWTRLHGRDTQPRPPRRNRPDLLRALEHLLADHIEENRPLPGRNGRVNASHLGRTLGTRVALSPPRYMRFIKAAAEIVGVEDGTYYATPVQGHFDGHPWLDRITVEQGNDSLPTLARMLQAACYTLISFYSGMRDSEVKHLRRGCLHIECDPDGIPYRWKAHSLAFKGEDDHKGVPAVWVVGEAAGRAIRVLEALQPADTEALFRPLPHGNGWRHRRTGRTLCSSATNLGLNRFVGWVNAYCAARNRQDGIPEVDGRTWRLKTSQFRRTLAWFIARRPGGAIAGAIAFRHHAIQMFEGYAGTSDSGFRAEVESEQALARGQFLLEMTDTHRHDDLVGPAAEEAERRLTRFGLHADGFAGTVITDERRLARLMKRHDPAIYPGTYVTCVFTHDKALCHKKTDSTGTLLPDQADCKPLTCGNVALTGDNASQWHVELDRIDGQLARRPRLPPLLEQRLDQRRQAITTFLARHTDQEQQ